MAYPFKQSNSLDLNLLIILFIDLKRIQYHGNILKFGCNYML